MERAIKLAESQGWRNKNFGYDCEVYEDEHALLDAEFWRCMGKALGWGETDNGSRDFTNHSEMPTWLIKQHRFIDHLAEGKTPESFFEGLLAKEKKT